MNCVLCQQPINNNKSEYWHRACGHHTCMRCAIPLIRAGKTHCSRCGPPKRIHVNVLGNLVLGTDSEQVARVEADLARARARQHEVGPMPPLPEISGDVNPCRGRMPDELCDGDPFCVHFCYDELTRDAMRAEVEYDGASVRAADSWVARVHNAVKRQLHPLQLVQCGFSAELFAYCGVSLRELLVHPDGAHRRRYALEHLLDAFGWQMEELLLLGFVITDLVHSFHYPLIALYQRAGLRANHLFALDIGYADLQRCVLDVDSRNASLLDLNLRYWHAALTVGA